MCGAPVAQVLSFVIHFWFHVTTFRCKLLLNGQGTSLLLSVMFPDFPCVIITPKPVFRVWQLDLHDALYAIMIHQHVLWTLRYNYALCNFPQLLSWEYREIYFKINHGVKMCSKGELAKSVWCFVFMCSIFVNEPIFISELILLSNDKVLWTTCFLSMMHLYCYACLCTTSEWEKKLALGSISELMMYPPWAVPLCWMICGQGINPYKYIFL